MRSWSASLEEPPSPRAMRSNSSILAASCLASSSCSLVRGPAVARRWRKEEICNNASSSWLARRTLAATALSRSLVTFSNASGAPESLPPPLPLLTASSNCLRKSSSCFSVSCLDSVISLRSSSISCCELALRSEISFSAASFASESSFSAASLASESSFSACSFSRFKSSISSFKSSTSELLSLSGASALAKAETETTGAGTTGGGEEGRKKRFPPLCKSGNSGFPFSTLFSSCSLRTQSSPSLHVDCSLMARRKEQSSAVWLASTTTLCVEGGSPRYSTGATKEPLIDKQKKFEKKKKFFFSSDPNFLIFVCLT